MVDFGKTILDYYKTKQYLTSGMLVKSNMIKNIELTICGFIPVLSDIDCLKTIVIDLYKDFIVGYGNLRLSLYNKDKIYSSILPIAQTIKYSKEKILVTSYIELLNADSVSLKKYQSVLLNKGFCDLVIKPVNNFEQIDGAKYYLPTEDEIVFERNNNIVGVASNFICLCSYINPITGQVSLTLQTPDNLYPIMFLEK